MKRLDFLDAEAYQYCCSQSEASEARDGSPIASCSGEQVRDLWGGGSADFRRTVVLGMPPPQGERLE
jgi:hypothetical protein